LAFIYRLKSFALFINGENVGSTLLPVICYIEVFFKICFAVRYYCQISSSVYQNLSIRFAIDFSVEL
jgi:hypothetical protein